MPNDDPNIEVELHAQASSFG
ncbi:uncharacterized protein G2W53_039015 [Senna tora]|uniref:Uncharacterized protein n=1 Tax=Senna tora TaxID=362788 RepID=A0A834W7J3_9FABA|nr:uncharacterized protein G2W53_039015 [Senna tora]